MPDRPLILLSPDIEERGKEFDDHSISLSNRYSNALLAAGGLPVTLAPTVDRELIAEYVRRADGVLLSGGDDVEPKLYGSKALPVHIRETVGVTPDGGGRDLMELVVIDEVFKQGKPLLAICRGQQILNVALGGTLFADIKSQVPGAINHRRSDERNDIVHEVRLTPGSKLAKITGQQRLGVNSTHHQAVARVAAPLRAIAVSEDGVIEGLELKPDAANRLPFLVSIQFHPERLADRYAEHGAIFGAFIQACKVLS